MNGAAFDLVIFDCDGTLVDSEDLSNRAMLAVLHECGLTQYDLDYARAHWPGTTVSDSLKVIEKETGQALPADFVARYNAHMRELQKTELLPVEGAAPLIGVCAARGKVCVASNGERNNVLQALTVAGLMPFFTAEKVFTKNQVERPKPYPDLFLYAAARMGAAADKCLVVEDSTTGARAGRAAGMTVWGFTGTAPDPQAHAAAMQAAGADSIFARLAQMAEIIEP